MKIIKTDIADLENDIVMLYKLTHGKSGKTATKLNVEELAQIYPVTAYLLYEDVNQKGENVELLSILSGDFVVTAQSATLKRSFFEILDIVGNRSFSIKFTDGKTKSDRRYMDCELASVD